MRCALVSRFISSFELKHVISANWKKIEPVNIKRPTNYSVGKKILLCWYALELILVQNLNCHFHGQIFRFRNFLRRADVIEATVL